MRVQAQGVFLCIADIPAVGSVFQARLVFGGGLFAIVKSLLSLSLFVSQFTKLKTLLEDEFPGDLEIVSDV